MAPYPGAHPRFQAGARVALFSLLGWMLAYASAWADLRPPAWYDEGAGVADWHYRVPVTLTGGTASGSTVVVDVDFLSLLDDMNVDTSAVTFDGRSPRVVRSNGVLVQEQEFVDAVYADALDATGNGRGQVRFIAEDAGGSGDYHLYFDITANGAKPASPAQVINGHFELSAGGTPTGWIRTALGAGGGQNNEVYATNLGQTVNLGAGCGTSAANGLDVAPNDLSGVATGRRWHLLGYRDNCEDGAGGNEQIRISRAIAVPSGGAAGVLEFYFQVQGFDGISNGSNYDWFVISVNGAAVNHGALNIDNTTNPALRIDNNRLGRNGYGGTVRDHGWKRARLDLSGFAGSTITFQVESRHSSADNSYRSWTKLDDVVWSRQAGTLGVVEAFGANIADPNDTGSGPASIYQVGETLAVTADVDVDVTQVLAYVYDESTTQVAGPIALFDDGTHGDATAGDREWRNDGSDAAFPTYTFLSTGPFGSNWMVRVLALDASVALGGATNGLLLVPGASTTPESQANFYNVDEQRFTLRGAQVDLGKSLLTISDPVAGATLPKAIPGAWIRYQVRVENQGPDGLDNDSIVVTDQIPSDVSVCVAAACTCAGPSCATVDPVAYDESASPIATGLSYSYVVDVEYSTDGVDYTYVPIPDADGFDADVRFVRVTPSGAMTQPSGGDNPEFELRYVVRLE